MILRYLFSAVAAISMAAIAVAGPLTPDQALARVQSTSGPAKAKALNSDRLTLVHTSISEEGRPAAYVFNRAERAGFMVLAADDCAAPVLGYADAGEFDPANMPDGLAWWLGEYAAQIDWSAKHGAIAYMVPKPRTDREPIAPMLKTLWDQVEPYNNMCPLYGVDRTYTGCVATSMAQIMKYWEYPERGQGSVSYNCSSIGKRLTMDFGLRDFDWANMLDTYVDGYTDAQADAVAYLMRACGYAVHMEFSTDASAALAMSIRKPLVENFKYDPNASYEIRSCYTASEWDEMIYQNLRNVGPIPYGGGSLLGGGHSFVCDGYDGNGYYHFNWGWSGMSNGYFLLDALCPTSLGAGGGGGGGYSFTQDAVLGIRPPTGEPEVVKPLEIIQGGSLTASVDDGKLKFGLVAENGASWINYNPLTLNVWFAAEFRSLDDASAAPVYGDAYEDYLTLRAGYGTSEIFEPIVDLAELNLADGRYRVTVVTDIREDSGNEWVPVRPFYGYYNYVDITKQGDKYTVAAHTLDTVRIVDGGVVGTLYYGGVAKFSIKVANDTDSEITRGFAPALFYSPDGGNAQLYFLGESQMITLAPHSVVEREWITDLVDMVGLPGVGTNMPMWLTFFDESNYNFYNDDIFKQVILKPNPGLSPVKITNFVADAQLKKFDVDGQVVRCYEVTDKMNIPVSYIIGLTGPEPFFYQLMACVLGDSVGEGEYEIVSYNGHAAMFTRSELYKFETVLSVPNMEANKVYIVIPAFIYGGGFAALSGDSIMLYMPGTSGIDDVIADDIDTNAPIYNLQGIYVGNDFDSLPTGTYIRAGVKIHK